MQNGDDDNDDDEDEELEKNVPRIVLMGLRG